MLFYFDCSKLIKFNWEPPATPANTARHNHVAAPMHVARQEEGSSAHRASVAGLSGAAKLTCRATWAGAGKRVRSANKIHVVLFLK
jgi:hypothetical protein